MDSAEGLASQSLNRQPHETLQKSSALLRLINTTANKVQYRLKPKQDIHPTDNSTQDLTTGSAQTNIAPTIIPAGTLYAPESGRDLDSQIDPLPNSASTTLNYVQGLVPEYSPDTHSTSLKEIMSNKEVNKVIIPLSDFATKRIRRQKEPQHTPQFANDELNGFIGEDRLPLQTLHLLDELRPYETMGLLPSPSKNLGFTTPLPIPIQRFVRCMAYFLAVHPEFRESRPLALTAYQEAAFKRMYDTFHDSKYSHITKPFETRISRTQHLFYKGSKENHEEYEKCWTGRFAHKGYRNMTLCFLKEYIITDFLNSIDDEKKRYIASDYDDKQHGFDLACIDIMTQRIGIVDATFNAGWVGRKLNEMDVRGSTDKYKDSEFVDYISQTTQESNDTIHTAVLQIDDKKFLQRFLVYVANVKKGKFHMPNILEKIADAPLPRERKHNFGNTTNKEFFSPKK